MIKWKNIVSVGIFAFFGGIIRYELGIWLPFFGTILVNLSGCFCLAFLTYYLISNNHGWSEWLTVGLGTGFIGAYTTFSTFNIDMLDLVVQTHTLPLGYFLGTIFGGFLCTYLGYLLAEKFSSRGAR